MKVILCSLGILVAAVCVNCEMPSELKQALGECHAELGMPDVKPEGPPNMDDPKVKCVKACLMKKMGNMVEGKMAVEKSIEFAKKHMPNPDDSLPEKITDCATRANEQTDECEVAAAMYHCVIEKFGPFPEHH